MGGWRHGSDEHFAREQSARSSAIWHIIHLVVSLGTRLVLSEGKNSVQGIIDHRVADHVEDNTLCRVDVDPTVVERPIVRHVIDDFINDDDEQLSI
ncbi:uncharacterized protein E6C27_scaffold409G00080 [Cucumis melo var. makuwa]|uniref:CACTA en-spm transposon protein n=1 Tax=Cucumis melo var. makuwa TaxID=1194695 RepID=A0A5A7UUB2_CUCMM|nr:uncharacterized protein E6C27_scaffold409G00080 [Cucumis melo var. makuwa]